MCDPFIEFNLESSNEERIFERKYTLLLDTLGDIGGIFELMSFIGAIFYFAYKKYAYDLFMRRELLIHSEDHYSQYLAGYSPKKIVKAMNQVIASQKDAG